MDFREAVRTISAEMASVLDAVDDKQAQDFIDAVISAERVFTTGEGRSGLVAKAFAMRLMHLGFVIWVVGETTTPPVGEGDLFVAVSGSGETPVTRHFAEAAAKAGASVAGVLADPDSSLAALCDRVLVVPGKVKTGVGKTSAQMPGSLFEQAAFAALEAVVLELAARKSETHDRMRQRHANLE